MTSAILGIFGSARFLFTRAISSLGESGKELESSALVMYCGGRKSSKVFAGRLTERARMRAGSLRSAYGIV
jgi:hypothetical protein